MSENLFKLGEMVVYPAHGVGIISGIETQNISGIDMRFVVISFDKDKMTVRLPLNKTTSNKLRKLCSKDEMHEALDCLRTPTKVKKTIWSRRAQEYESKINSGIPLSIAQVVRELHRSTGQPDHSYSERTIYQEALDRLSKEYAAVIQVDEAQAMRDIYSALNTA